MTIICLCINIHFLSSNILNIIFLLLSWPAKMSYCGTILHKTCFFTFTKFQLSDIFCTFETETEIFKPYEQYLCKIRCNDACGPLNSKFEEWLNLCSSTFWLTASIFSDFLERRAQFFSLHHLLFPKASYSIEVSKCVQLFHLSNDVVSAFQMSTLTVTNIPGDPKLHLLLETSKHVQ